MPKLPKHPSTRARRNKVAGARTLSAVHDVETPELPAFDDVEWHPMTLSWWEDIWASPMAPEYDDSDIHGLYALAMLVNAFWYEPSTGLASEIRLQRQCFGLSPIDRRRLQWEIEQGERAEQSTRQRRNEQALSGTGAVEMPPPSATKAKWVDWLVEHRNLSRSTLDAMSKKKIVAEYSQSASADARDALTG
jgi:hypothetical protein